MRSRFIWPLTLAAVVAATAISATACGGDGDGDGDGGEDQVTEAIQTLVSESQADAIACAENATDNYVQTVTGAPAGSGLFDCGDLIKPLGTPGSIEVASVEVNDDTATASATLNDGARAGQTATIGLVKGASYYDEADTWKVDTVQ